MSTASIQKIYNIQKHPNADSLSVAKVLGWQVVFNHTQHTYKENDLVVYVEIDSLLPDKPEFEFLRKLNFRIKAVTLRGVESAGIIFPLTILGTPVLHPMTFEAVGFNQNKDEALKFEGLGQDVSECIGASHYTKPVPVEMAGEAYGGLPGFLKMTDEKNLRSFPDTIKALKEQPYYITRKDDGTSATYFINNGEFGVCSRNVHLKPSITNLFWRLAEKYQIEKALREFFPNRDVAIQGEIVGPNINGNHLGLKEAELHIFNVWYINERMYGNMDCLLDFSIATKIPLVETLELGTAFKYDLDQLIQVANKQKYPNASPAEGIVIRSQNPLPCLLLGGWWSGKIINENWKEE